MTGAKAQSIHDRLLNLAHERQVDFNRILFRYGVERLMYRISKSPYADRFVLKGAMLFMLWLGHEHRPTKDIDLLGFGNLDEKSLREIFDCVCNLKVEEDGIVFDSTSFKIEEIREAEIYQGLRLNLRGTLGSANLSAYPPETVVAEKLDAIILFGIRNSRMKDYFDLWTLANNFNFEGAVLKDAIKATLKQRGRKTPFDLPVGLQREFVNDQTKQIQGKAFINRAVPQNSDLTLEQIVRKIGELLAPVLKSYAIDQKFDQQWLAAKGWTLNEE